MAGPTKNQTSSGKKRNPGEITFTCQSCHKEKPLEDMRTVTRFVPVLVVCRNCQKEFR